MDVFCPELPKGQGGPSDHLDTPYRGIGIRRTLGLKDLQTDAPRHLDVAFLVPRGKNKAGEFWHMR